METMIFSNYGEMARYINTILHKEAKHFTAKFTTKYALFNDPIEVNVRIDGKVSMPNYAILRCCKEE